MSSQFRQQHDGQVQLPGVDAVQAGAVEVSGEHQLSLGRTDSPPGQSVIVAERVQKLDVSEYAPGESDEEEGWRHAHPA